MFSLQATNRCKHKQIHCCLWRQIISICVKWRMFNFVKVVTDRQERPFLDVDLSKPVKNQSMSRHFSLVAIKPGEKTLFGSIFFCYATMAYWMTRYHRISNIFWKHIDVKMFTEIVHSSLNLFFFYHWIVPSSKYYVYIQLFCNSKCSQTFFFFFFPFFCKLQNVDSLLNVSAKCSLTGSCYSIIELHVYLLAALKRKTVVLFDTEKVCSGLKLDTAGCINI